MASTPVRTLLPLLVVLAACLPAAAQESRNPSPLNRWLAKGDISVQTHANLMRVSGRGLIRTDVEYLDFVLRLRLRVITPDAQGAVLLRDWEGYGEPRTGYRLAIRGPSVTRRVPLLTAMRSDTRVVSGGPDASMPNLEVGSWHQMEIACAHDRIAIRLDGKELAAVEGREPQAGTIGIEAVKGVIEYDDVSVIPTEVPHGEISGTSPESAAVRIGARAPGIASPRVTREIRPRYLREGMTSKTQGTVVLEVVVLPDGRVGEISVVKSLQRDLDLEAVGAARRWQFTPARRGDTPIAVIAAIEMTFILQ